MCSSDLVPSLIQLWPPQPDPNRRQWTMLLASSSLCLLLMAWQPHFRPLAWLGRRAYPVFLFHPFFTAAARIALEPVRDLPLALQVMLGLAAGLIGPTLLARGLRQWYWTNLLLLGQSASQPAPQKPAPARTAVQSPSA